MPTQTWTPLPLIQTTAAFFAKKEIPTPRLDAEVLLCHVLGLSRRIELYTSFERPLTEGEVEGYRALVRRRVQREPVSHILGYREFMGIRFTVTRDVLAPRPETEILVEEAVRLLQERGESADAASARVLDLGTGSGCIAVSLAALCPRAAVLATDLSPAALAVACGNAESAGVADRVAFGEGDLFAAIPTGQTFDLILSNPPYVADGDPGVWPEVRDYEPAMAVFCGADPYSFHRRIAAGVETWLNPGGWLLVEVGQGQAQGVEAIWAEETGLGEIRSLADHAGCGRVVVGRKSLA